ncbi:helix-turn-helix domain-containing protein [Pedobacter helvus]|uniref:Helix-turn-helix domain-containing protein n=1 Tax=Pedobacter helvus TaxID=2563444 RepID=A0ABW9JJ58_9SPHI|nr:helix-turn-helix domain-containing protein [Pedobacter ureilyticus]
MGNTDGKQGCKTEKYWPADKLQSENGHFNVFRLDSSIANGEKSIPYGRRDFYKITLVAGKGKFLYADKIVEVQRYTVAFSNPQIPYGWEEGETVTSGYFCVFNQAFFHQYGNLKNYTLFQPDGNHVFELHQDQMDYYTGLFNRMFDEINSDYIHKYDVLRTVVFEMIHTALKMQPNTKWEKLEINASQRVTTLFLELLERQFPIENSRQALTLRFAKDYATKLNIHTNYLNRSVKETTGKTTSQIIAERVYQEAKLLLKQTSCGVAEIAYVLGFSEATHFNNFFKKHHKTSPTLFRKF